MEKACRSFLFLVFLFCINANASGDVCLLDLRETNVAGAAEFDDLVVCQQGDTLSILVAGESVTSGATLEVQLPNGLIYSGGASLGDGTSLSLVSSDPPILSLPSFGGTDSLVVNIPIEGTCPIVDVWEEPAPIYITYVLNTGSGAFPFTPALAYNNGIFIPVINILSITPDYPILNVGDSYTRIIEVSQDGLKAFLDGFTYQSDNPAEVVVTNLEIGPVGGTSIPLNFTLNGSDLTAEVTSNDLQAIGYGGIWDETQTLLLYETVYAEACFTENFTSDFHFSWGCNGELCRTTSTTNGFNVGGGLPIIDFIVNEESGEGLCGSNVLDITVVNNGNENIPNSAYAKDFLLNLVQSCAPENFPAHFEFTSVSVNGGAGNLPVFNGITHVVDLTGMGILEDLDNDGIEDDLALNASFNVRIEYSRVCQDFSCGEAALTCPSGWVVEADFTDQCGEINGSEIYTVPGPSIETLISSSISSIPEISGEGATMPFSYCYAYNVNTIECSGATVGLKFSTSNSGVTVSSAMVNGQSVGVTDLGNDEYLIPGGAVTNVDGPIEDCWELELIYNGPCDNDGPGTFDVEVVYECPCVGCSQTRVCDTYYYVVYNACSGGNGTCDGIAINDYSVERTSFGWTDETASQLADASTPGMLLDRAYTCDGVSIEVTGNVTAITVNDFDYIVTFSADEMMVPFDFDGGVVSVNGSVACITLPAPSVSTLSDGRIEWAFDLDACIGGSLSEGDIIDLNINLSVRDSEDIPPYFELVQVQGLFLTDADGECDLQINDFYVMNPEVTTSLEVVSIPDGCANNVVLHGDVNAVGPIGDDFPNEYRPWVGNFGNFSIQIPVGYSYINASAYVLPMQGSMAGDTIYINAITNSTEVIFNNIENLLDVPDKTDNGPILSFGIELLPTCSTERIGESYFSYNFEDNYYSITGPNPCSQSQSGSTLGILNYTEPIFNLTALNPIREGINEVVEWDVEICDVNNVSVNHSWLTFDKLSNDIFLQSVTDITDANNPIVLNINSYNPELTWASIGGFDGSGCRVYRFAATFEECNPSDAQVIFNWNCEDNVAGPFGGNDCGEGKLSVPVSLLPQEAAIQANLLNHTDTVGLCNQGFFEIEFKNVKKGTVYDIIFDIIIPLEGVSFVPGSFEIAYPINTAYQPIGFEPTLMGATPLGFQYRYEMNDVDAEFLAGLASIPSQSDTENRYKIRFDFETECGFISGDIFRFITYGFGPCGEQTVGTFQNEDVHLEGGAPEYSLQTTMLTEEIKPCEEPSTFTVRVQNLGPTPSNAGDIVRIRLPEGIFYLPNTSVATAPSTWTIDEPSVNNIFNFEELTWVLSNSIAVNDFVEFTFQLNAEDNLTCINEPVSINSFAGTQLTCGSTGDLCDVLIQTGGQDVFIEVVKPDLQFIETTTSLSASPTCNGSNTELLTASIGMVNNGVANPAGIFTYFNFVHDGNGNGIYDAGVDQVIYTHTYENPIEAGGVINFFVDFEVEAGLTCPVLLVVDDESNCVCGESIFNFPEVSYENAGPDVIVCAGSDTQLGCDGLENYTYTWTPEDGSLSCYDCPNPSIIANNSGNLSSTTTYWLTTDRGNSCVSSDQVVVTFLPQTITNSNTVLACEGELIQLSGPTGGSNYLWSPTTGIDNPTSANPALTVQEGTYTYTLEYTDESGCTALYVKSFVGQPSVTTNISVTGETSFCAGEPSNVILDAGTGFVSYAWFMEEDASFTANTQTIMPTMAGTYYVVVEDGTNGSCSGIPSPPIAISSVTTSNPIIIVDGGLEFCFGETTTLNITGNNQSVEWYASNLAGEPTGNVLFVGSSFETSSTGNYVAVVTDNNGCTVESNNVQVNLLPVLPISINDGGMNSTICEGETMLLSASFGFNNYIWYLEGDFFASGNSSISVSQEGAYTVEASGQNTCISGSNSFNVIVEANPNPNIQASGPLTFCEGESVDLSVSDGFETYQWLLNDTPINNENTPNISLAASGTYSVEVRDNNDCVGTSNLVDVIVNPLPQISIVATSEIGCEEEVITINSSGSFVTYEWFFNGNPYDSPSIANIEVTSSGDYYLIGTDQNGCMAISNTLSIEYTIIEEANLVTSAASICPGEGIVLSVDDGFGQYNWYVGDVLVQSGASETYELNEAATVVVDYVDENGCVGTTNIVTITETNAAVPALNVFGSEFICPDESITLEVEGVFETYQWFFNDVEIAGATLASYTAVEEGVYYVIVSNSTGCEGISPNIELTIGTPIVPEISTLNTQVCQGETSIISLTNGPFDAVQWYLNGTAIFNATGNSITADQSGAYSVEILNSDACSYSSESIDIIYFNETSAVLTALDNDLCNGETTTLNITEGFVQYDWFVNGSLVQTGANSSYTANVAGNIYVEYTDGNGCLDTSNEVNIVENGALAPSLNTPGPLTICEGEVYELMVMEVFETYQWYLNGTPISNATNQSFFPNVAGIYSVLVTNSNGCEGETIDVEITVEIITPPIISSESNSFCANSELTIEIDNGPYNLIQWFVNGEAIINETGNTLVVNVPGVYSVMVGNGGKCTGTSNEIQITETDSETGILMAAQSNICEGSALTMSVTEGFEQYDWYVNDVLVQSGPSNEYYLEDSGTVMVVYTDANACQSTTNSLSISEAGTPPPTTNVVGVENVCTGETLDLTVMEFYEEYQWYLDGIALEGGTFPDLEALAEGAYYAEVVNGECVFQTEEILVQIAPSIDPIISVNQTIDCPDGIFEFTLGNGPFEEIQWYIGSLPIVGENNSTLVTTSPGTYYAIVSNEGTCPATTEEIVVTNYTPQEGELAAGSTNICAGANLTISATPGFQEYTWMVNGLVIQVGDSNEFVLNSSGLIVVSYIDANGCEGMTNSVFISENEAPNPFLNISGTQTLCAGDPFELSLTESYDNYQWYINGNPIVGANESTYVANQVGVYFAVVSNESICEGQTPDVTFILEEIEMPLISSNTTAICAGQAFTITLENGPYTNVQWYRDGLPIFNETNESITSNILGYYFVEVNGGEACSVDSDGIFINVLNPESATITSNTSNICEGGTLTLTATDGYSNYNWYVNGVLIQSNAGHIFETEDAGLVVLEYIDNNGCLGTVEDISIVESPSPVPALNVTGTQNVCTGESFELAVVELYENYQWYLNGNAIDGATNAIYSATTGGIYYAIVGNGNGCSGQTPDVEVIVGSTTNPTIEANQTTICSGGVFMLNLTNGPFQNIQWYLDGLPIFNEFGTSLVSNEPGLYYAETSNGDDCFGISNDIVINELNIQGMDITSDGTTICEGAFVTVTAPVGMQEYTWYVNGSMVQSGTDNVLNLSEGGLVYVTFIGGDDCVGTSNQLVISEVPALLPGINLSGTQSICNGESLSLSIFQTYTNYQWYLNGNVIDNATDAIYSASTSGVYYAVVSNGDGCTGQTPDVEVVVGNITIPTIEADQTTICSGGVFTLNLTNGPFQNIQWYLDGIAVYNEFGTSLVSNEPGIYYVETSNGDDCFGTSNEIVINELNMQGMTITSDETTICEGAFVAVNAPLGMQEYTWYVNGSMVQSGTNNVLNLSDGGLVYVTFIGEDGCTGTSNQFVITEIPAPLPSINLSGTQIICDGESIVLSVLQTYTSYQWYLDGTPIAGATEANYTAQNQGLYYAIVGDGGACDGQTLAVDLVVQETPNPIIEVNDIEVCEGDEFVFTLINGPFDIMQWYKDGQPIWGETTETTTMEFAGTYHVVVTHENGCSNSSNEVTVTVNSVSPLYLQTNTTANFCEGGSVNITASTGFDNYVWVLDGTVVQDGTSNQYVASESGAVYVVGTDANACEVTSGSIEVVTNPLPQPEIVLSNGDVNLCEDESVLLSVAGSYQLVNWFLDGELIPGAVSNVILAELPGSYTVFVDDLAGCDGTSEPFIINLQETSEVPVQSSSDTNSICEGEEIVLTADAGFDVYDWYFNGSLIFTGSNVYTTNSAGVYYVEVSGDDICNAISDAIVVTQNETPTPALQILDGSLEMCFEEAAIIAVTSVYDTYDWYLDGELIEGEHEAVCVAYISGTYYAVVSNGNCTGQTVPVNINFADELVPPIINPVQGICEGDLLTIATLPIYETYQWYKDGVALSNNFTTEITISSGGTYELYVEDNNGCEGWSEEMVIEDYPLPMIELTEDELFCPGGSTQVHATEGFLVYEWFVNGELVSNSGNPDFTLLEESEIFVTVTDLNGCQNTSTALDIDFSPVPNPGISIDGDLDFCEGGEVHLTVDQNYQSIQWLKDGIPVDNANELDFIANASGVYSVLVNNGFCDGISDGIEVIAYDLPNAFVAASTEAPYCLGESIMLFTSDTFESYQWYHNGLPIFEATTNTISSGQSGAYYVELASIDGCVGFTDTLDLFFNDLTEIAITIDEGSNFCEGGSVMMQATPGFFTYTWLLNEEIVQSGPSDDFEMVGSGTVIVLGEDVNTCTNASEPVEINTLALPEPEIIVSGTTTLCEGEGVTLGVSGVYPLIEWYNDGVLIPSLGTNSIVVNTAGSYTVLVDNFDGCSGTSAPIEVVVEASPEVTIVEAISTDGLCEGATTTLQATPGYTNYTWYLNGFVLLQDGPEADINVTESGLYAVVVATGNGCTGQSNQLTVEFGASPSINLTASHQSVCSGEESILFAGSYGETFTWTPNDGSLSCLDCASPAASPTQTTTYTVTVSNSNGCSNEESITINVLDQDIDLTLIDSSGSTCIGTGHELSVPVGYDNYLWVLDGITFVQNGSNNTFTATLPGTYQVIATSTNDCELTSNEVLVEFNPSPASIEIEITSEGGLCDDEPFEIVATSDGNTYLWTINADLTISENPEGASLSFDAENGQFTVVVSNEFGCSTAAGPIDWTPNVLELPEIFAQELAGCEGQLFSISCPGNYDEIQWYQDGLPIDGATYSILEVTQTGNYSVYVVDKNGCDGLSDNILITIFEAPEPILSPDNLSLCLEGDLSGLELSATPGYVNYDWYLFGLLMVQSGTDNTYVPDEAGLYTVEVTDENGCTGVSNVSDVNIAEPPFVLVTAANNTLCPGEASELFVSAPPNASLAWSDGGNNVSLSCLDCPNPSIAVQESTTYTVTVTTPEGCVNSSSVTIQVNSVDDLSLTALEENVCDGEDIPLLATNGLSNYTWYFNNAIISGQNQSTLLANEAGVYSYSTITNQGCITYSPEVPLAFNENPEVGINVSNVFCEAGQVEVLAIPEGFAQYEFIFNGQSQGLNESNVFTASQSGEVFVVAYDEIGCTTSSVLINVNVEGSTTPIIIPSQLDGNICEGENITLAVQGMYVSYQWYLNGTPFSTESTVVVSETGGYTVEVSSGGSCEGVSAPFIVTVNSIDPPAILSPDGFDLVCFEDLPYYIIAESGFVGYDWYLDGVLVSTGTGNDSLSVIEGGVYTLVGINDAGCETSNPDEVLIQVFDFVDLDMDATEFFVCAGEEVTLSANSIQGDFFAWTSDVTDELSCLVCPNPVVTPEETTIYSVEVTDDNGCFVTGNVTIVVADEPIPEITTETTSLCEASEEVTIGVSNDDYFAYQWYLNGDPIDGENAAFLTTQVGGDFYVEVTTFSACSLNSNTVTIDGFSVEIPVVTVSNNQLCDVGIEAILDAGLQSDGNAYISYSWFGNTGGVPIGDGQTFAPSSPGEYFVIVEGENGCTASSAPVEVLDGPTAPSIGSNFESVCDGSAPAIYVESDVEYIYWFEFSNPQDTINEISTDTIFVENPGIYFAMVGDNEDCLAITDGIDVEVYDDISNQIGFDLDNIVCLGESQTVSYFGEVTNQDVLSWDFGGANFVFSATDNQHQLSWNEGGTFNVAVSFAVGDCTFEFSDSIVVYDVNANVEMFVDSVCIDTCVGALGSYLLTFNQDTSDMEILWSGPNGFSANTFFIDNLELGTYNAFIQDSVGCSFERVFEMCMQDPEGDELSANPDVLNIETSGPEILCVLDNDTGNDPMITDVTNIPEEVVVDIIGDCLQIIPPPDFTGEFTISYIIQDQCGNFDFTDVTVNVGPPGVINEPPSLLTIEGTLSCVDLVTATEICLDIIDPNGDPVTITEVESGIGGLTSIANDSCINYLFNQDFLPKGAEDTLAIDTVMVTICDTFGACIPSPLVLYILDCEPPTIDSLYTDICIDSTDPQTLCPVFEDPTGLDLNIDFVYTNSDGDVTIDDDCLIYTPPNEPLTSDTVFIEVCNALTYCSTSIWVLTGEECEPNNPPNTDTLTLDICSGEIVPTLVCHEFTDPDGDSVEIVDLDSHFNCGADVVDGCIEYIVLPGLDELMDTVSITVCDDQGACSTSYLLVNIEDCDNVCETLLAEDDNYSIENDEVLIFNPLENDEGTEITLNSFMSLPSNGSLIINSDGTYTYDPIDEFMGTETFQYTVSDSCENLSIATVTIFVIPNNNATNNNAPNEENLLWTVCDNEFEQQVFCYDFVDIDGDAVAITQANSVNNDIIPMSTVAVYSDSCIVYTMDPNNPISEEIELKVCDELGLCSYTVLTIEVLACAPPNPGNQEAPLIDTLNITICENDITEQSICHNFTDPNGDATFVSDVNSLFGCSTEIVDSSCFTYILIPGLTGEDIVEVTVCDDTGLCSTSILIVTIEDCTIDPPVINQPPNVDTLYTTVCEGSFDTEIVCNNFTDPDGDDVSIDDLQSLFDCSLEILEDGCFSYILIPGLTGEDIVEITVCDEFGLCSTSILFVTIDPCVQVEPCDPELTAGNDYFEITNDGVAVLDILANDAGVDLTFDGIIIFPISGSLGINSDGTINYLPFDGATGTDWFEYALSDSCGNTLTATAEVIFVDEVVPCDNISHTCVEPIVQTQICLDFCNLPVDGNSFISVSTEFNCSINDIDFPCISYISVPGEFTHDTLTVVATSADGVFDTAYVNIAIGNCSGITANDDTYFIPYETSFSMEVMDNDLGDSLEVTNVIQPGYGSVFVTGGGLLYQAANGFSGEDVFTYEVCNEDGGCDIGTVTIVVEGPCENYFEICAAPNSPVQICPDFCEWSEDYSINSVLSNETSNFVINGVNCIEFTPQGGQEYTDTLIITACELGGTNCQEAIVVVDVNCSAPIAIDDEVNMEVEMNQIVFNVLENDVAPCNGELNVNDFTQPSNGSITDLGGGNLLFTPDSAFVGLDAFVYEVCNGCSTDCEQGIVLLGVLDPLGLLANDDNYEAENNAQISFNVLENDEFSNNANISSWTMPENGDLLYFNGSFLYFPDETFVGTDEFFYEICANGVCDMASVRIDVSGTEELIDNLEDCEIFVPNAFSPNSDGTNDKLVINGLDCYLNNGLHIYDRNGTEVFSIAPYTNDALWDGTNTKGRELREGVYFYIFVPDEQQPTIVQKGFITIKR